MGSLTLTRNSLREINVLEKKESLSEFPFLFVSAWLILSVGCCPSSYFFALQSRALLTESSLLQDFGQ